MKLHVRCIYIYNISIVDNESLFKMMNKIINEMSIFYNILVIWRQDMYIYMYSTICVLVWRQVLTCLPIVTMYTYVCVNVYYFICSVEASPDLHLLIISLAVGVNLFGFSSILSVTYVCILEDVDTFKRPLSLLESVNICYHINMNK